MPKREGWIKVDRRLSDHWKVRRLASVFGMPRWSVVGALAYLWGLAEDVGPCLGPFFAEADHELPEGFVAALGEVGWAHQGEDGTWCMSTREESAKTLEMRALAQARWDGMRAHPDRNAEAMRAHADRNAKPMRSHTRRSARERERERDRETDASASAAAAGPASGLNGSLGPADVIAQLRAIS
jgi:hypothetical protein